MPLFPFLRSINGEVIVSFLSFHPCLNFPTLKLGSSMNTPFFSSHSSILFSMSSEVWLSTGEIEWLSEVTGVSFWAAYSKLLSRNVKNDVAEIDYKGIRAFLKNKGTYLALDRKEKGHFELWDIKKFINYKNE